MTVKQTRYGTWPSPVSSALITTDAVSPDEIRLHKEAAYWIEKRPAEQGRCVIVKHEHGCTSDILPDSYSARSRVHEYGGGVYCISDTGVYFVNDHDQNIYHLSNDGTTRAITRTSNTSYADLQFDNRRQRLICIRQQCEQADAEPANTLIAINPDTGICQTLHSGYDFYSNPRLSPCGTRLCWLCWNHPDMPWDKTHLWLAETSDSQLHNAHRLNLSSKDNFSVFQPEWSPDNILYFISDVTGWWNLFRYVNAETEQLTNLQCEFGRPQWVFAQSVYTFIDSSHLLCAPVENGNTRLTILDLNTKSFIPIEITCTSISSLQSLHDRSWFITASENTFPEIAHLDNKTLGYNSIRSSSTINLDNSIYSHGQVIKFETRHHDEVYAIYYPPLNTNVVADTAENPPLIVLTHGGPTAMSDASLDLRKQFWTTRGFAILDVNYSGSTGFGRSYRERLNNNWGIRDAEDCCDAALHLVKLGLADPDRLIIKGSSAGGYTVLCALTFHHVFAAGASYYGIGNLESLLDDTHKFESRYLDRLIGHYPEHKKRYQDRSPLNHADQLDVPVIFFQGTGDKVVPMSQAEQMHSALKAKGVPVACIYFSGEQHGFRKAETIRTAIDTEYAFYCKIFRLDVDNTLPLQIDNFTP